MRNLYKYIVIALAGAALLCSCESQLDVQQHGVTSLSNYYKTDNDANEAISSVYYRWQNNNIGSMSMWYLLNLPSDDMYAGGLKRGANLPIQDLCEFTYDSANSHIKNVYTNLYQMIYGCNVILDNFTEPSTAVQKQVVAEAKFFRAWCYFYLAHFWGTPPIVDHVLAADEYLQPNSDKDALWAFIESDLKDAINSGALPEKTSKDDVQVRVTKAAAQAWLGKVYVWEKKWSDARTMFDAVISSNKYDLYTGNYGDILRSKSDWSCESVLETNIIRDASNLVTTSIYQQTCWRSELYNWSGNTLDIVKGWGQANPTKDLYDAFVEREGVNGYRLTNTIFTYDQLLAGGVKIIPGKTLEQHDGYWSWKHRFSAADQITGSYVCCDTRAMRYAEVLLLAAEAELNGGSAAKATEYVNKIRSRAKLASLANVTMDDVKIEKRLELCYEGIRFMDLVRWGDASTVLATKGQKIGSYSSDGQYYPEAFTYPESGFKSRNYLLPFPQAEMLVNTKLVQNEGY